MTEARREKWWKIAVVAVIAIELLGGASGWLSNSGYGNAWFDALQKPSFMPPGWVFGVVWPILYALLGIALAMIQAEPSSPRRQAALTLFFIQPSRPVHHTCSESLNGCSATTCLHKQCFTSLADAHALTRRLQPRHTARLVGRRHARAV